MTRKKVKLAFIENNTERRASYRKREKGFLKKAHDLNILCDVELATIVNSPYHEEPKVFPNHEAASNMFTKFQDLPEVDKSKNMVTQEKITSKRIEKIENKLMKIRKENRRLEFTNQMYELLNGEEMPTSMDPEDLNDLSYVIHQSLKQVNDAIKEKANKNRSTSDAPQPIGGPLDSGGTSFDKPWDPLLAPVGASVSEVPLLVPSTVPSGTNFERPRALMLVPDVTSISMVPPMAPLMVPSNAHAQVPQLMFPRVSPPQMFPLVDLSQVPSSLSSQIFSPMVSQRYPLIFHQMDFRRATEMDHPIPPTTTAYPMSSPMIVPTMAPQIDPPMNIPAMSASVLMDNNHSLGIPRSPSFSQLLSLNDDEIMTLLEDTSFDINVEDPNHINL